MPLRTTVEDRPSREPRSWVGGVVSLSLVAFALYLAARTYFPSSPLVRLPIRALKAPGRAVAAFRISSGEWLVRAGRWLRGPL